MASLIPISPSPTCETGECAAPPKLALLDDGDNHVSVHCNRHAVGALNALIEKLAGQPVAKPEGA